MSVGRVIDGKLAVRDGRLACDCCGDGDDTTPPWVCPDCPDWGGPGGPQRPTNPDGVPRCCTGNTICSPNDSEKIYLGIRITGTIANTYTYASGPNAGIPFNYSSDFNRVFTLESNDTACDITLSPSFFVTVPFRLQDSTEPIDRNIGIAAFGAVWNRERGFFGNNTDSGDDPDGNIGSGIAVNIGTSGAPGGPIRGTRNSGYRFDLRVCRSDFPLLPITARPDTFRILSLATTLDSGTRTASTPIGVCLNRVITEYSNTFELSSGSGTDNVEVLYRFYCFASRIAPCLIV